MEDPVANAILNQYFRRLEQALSDVPAERRTQIIEDLRAHVDESLAAETDHSDATVLAILDRLGDPDEIAHEALTDEGADAGAGIEAEAGPRANSQPGAAASTTDSAGATTSSTALLLRPKALIGSVAAAALAMAVVLVLILTGGSAAGSSKTAKTVADPPGHALAHDPPQKSGSGAWLPAAAVSGGGGIDDSECSPQTTSGSIPAATLKSGAMQVAAGSVDGLKWSVWSKKGQSGANGLEAGGVIVNGVAHGLCPGFPNPVEMELLEPPAGGDGIAYGVVGYPGSAKVNIYQSTDSTFDTGKLLASTTAQKVNGVGFFITKLSASGCTNNSLELNTASHDYAAEHNLGFSTANCSKGQLVPINDSQGNWQLPTHDFPTHLQNATSNLTGSQGAGGGATDAGLTKGGWLPAGDISGGGGIDNSGCSSQTLSGSEPASTLEAGATQVASGSVEGHKWSVWSKKGQSGSTGLEDSGVVVDGVAHGLCPGFPNPAEMELLEPSGGGDGIVYGVIGYPGIARIDIYSSTDQTFDTGKLLGSFTAQKVNGVAFFIGALSVSGCKDGSLELNTASHDYAAEHNLGFNTARCKDGELVPIDDSQGIWQLPVSDFPNKYQSGGGGGGGMAPVTKGGWIPAGDISGGGGIDDSECSPQTTSGSIPAATLKSGAMQVAAGSVDGLKWSVWSKKGQSGANGLEAGGVIVNGVAHGLCPGFPNPVEMELLEPPAGGDGIAYGVVGYPGSAKVNIYQSTDSTFDTGKLLASTTAQKVNGVGFFITKLSASGCTNNSLELNTASHDYAAEHNLGFSTANCSKGQLVPINDSQGNWQLPTHDFPTHLQNATSNLTGSQGAGGGRLFRTGPDFSSCSPRTNTSSSGQAMTSVVHATKVASGTVDGHRWSLWSKNGENGSAALENAGVIVDGHSYGICPGAPNPAEFELLDPPGGGKAIVVGVSGYTGAATAKLYIGTAGTFNQGAMLYGGHTVSADGTGFFIAELPKSACAYNSLELRVNAKGGSSQHNLDFGSCTAGKLSMIEGGQGAWGGT